MGTCSAILVLLMAIIVGLTLYIYTTPEATPPRIQHGWWGRGPPKSANEEDKTLKEFDINISDAAVVDFKARLEHARFPEDLENGDFQYGFQADYMKVVQKYWLENYDWRKYEKELNRFDHFLTRIEGIDVHFLRADPVDKTVKAKPLLMIHGWPGSVWEFNKILPMLTDPVKYGGKVEDTFQVFCPSIPGYGFSEKPHQKGFDSVAAAGVFVEMMRRNGHEQFYVQGGDWGSIIGVNIAQLYPQHVTGLHLNLILAGLPWSPGLTLHKMAAFMLPSIFLSKADQARLQPMTVVYSNLIKESGYMHLQGTKPDTPAFGLNDSPIGLAAYILEKFSTWTNQSYRDLKDGGLTKSYTLDDLLTNVMIYWFTETIGSSMRFYKETIPSDNTQILDKVPVKVPTGVARFPNEPFNDLETFAAHKYHDIVQYTDLPEGGHFPAMEQPKALAQHIWEFVRQVEARPKV